MQFCSAVLEVEPGFNSHIPSPAQPSPSSYLEITPESPTRETAPLGKQPRASPRILATCGKVTRMSLNTMLQGNICLLPLVKVTSPVFDRK